MSKATDGEEEELVLFLLCHRIVYLSLPARVGLSRHLSVSGNGRFPVRFYSRIGRLVGRGCEACL